MNSGNIIKEEKLEKKESINVFDNLKSDYFLRKIFDYIKDYNKLKILNYNKKIQKRINLNINNYKEYSQLYSNIEIELKLVNNKYGDFIRILEKNKKYYHIYFDNSKEEIKRYHINKNEKVKTIKIIINHQVKDLNSLFVNCKCINSIFFKKFSRNNITNMAGMFFGCTS